MTDEQIQSWLSNQLSVPCILVEAVARISGVETTIYMANKGYVTKPTDSPSNTYYEPRISNNVFFEESITLDSEPNVSFGDLIIDNTDGLRDSYVDYIWDARDITVYYGDLSWDRSDFFAVFTGKIESVDSRSKNELILKVRDKLQQLNYPITDEVLGGTTSDKETLIPLSFGEVCNMEPLLIDPALHVYQSHNGAIEGHIEVRDFGVPLIKGVNCTDPDTTGYFEDVSTGKFTLCNFPAGTITASIQGDKNATYNVTVATIIQHIVKTYGPNVFTNSDIDTTNFSDFDTLNQQQVSYHASSKENILSIISQLANSLGSQLICNREGKLQIFKIDLPPSGTTYEVNENDILQNSLELVDLPPIIVSVKLGYCKNYTVQSDLQTGILEEHKRLFSKEYIDVLATDQSLATIYKMDLETDRKETSLIDETEATTEATRLLNLWKVQRKVYRFTGIARLMTLSLGQKITIKNSVYGLDAGVEGMLISMNTDWTNRNVVCEVLV